MYLLPCRIFTVGLLKLFQSSFLDIVEKLKKLGFFWAYIWFCCSYHCRTQNDYFTFLTYSEESNYYGAWTMTLVSFNLFVGRSESGIHRPCCILSTHFLNSTFFVLVLIQKGTKKNSPEYISYYRVHHQLIQVPKNYCCLWILHEYT